MPTTKEFKSKLNGKKAPPIEVDEEIDETETEIVTDETDATAASRPQRRPGRADKVKAKTSTEDYDDADLETEFTDDEETPKIEINFKGSELLRSKFPKPFEVAEAVATEWVNGGDFENLPVGHPLAQWAAQKGLTKAKEMEKKILESPALEKVAYQALTLGMKAQSFVGKMKSKFGGKKSED